MTYSSPSFKSSATTIDDIKKNISSIAWQFILSNDLLFIFNGKKCRP